MDNYVVYHLHSDLSNGVTNVDSVTKFGEYIEAAKKLGMKAMAFSEHGNIFEWFHKKEAIENAGMKYIHAVEAYITEDNNSDHKRTVYSAIDLFTSSTAKKDVRISFENYYKREDGVYLAKCIDDDKTYPIDPESIREEKVVKTRDNYHCVLIAKNHAGVREINRLTSQSFCRTDSHFYYMPRIYLDDLLNTSDNVIVTSACLGGILSKGADEVKERFLDFCIKNKHRCYLEIQHHNVEDQKNYNKELYALSREYGIPLIAGTDTHALNDTHMEGRKILQLSKGVHFAEEDAWDLTFKSFETLCEAYKRQDSLPEEVWMEAIMNTNRMADCVETFELDRNTKYPKIYDHPLQTYKQKINQAYKVHPYVRKRYKSEEINPIIRDEVDVYEKTKSIDFMLLQTYLREWETKHDIFCGYGRGSVSGSEVAYILGITQMDSKKFGLNFFRFMNPSRVTNADIDTDYSSRDRDIIKQFILRDHMDLPNIRASEIITFNTIALKGAIKDVGRALRMSIVETSAISEAVYLEDGKWIIDDVFRERYPDLFKYVDIVSGTIVSIGSHPSGVLVSDLNIDEEPNYDLYRLALRSTAQRLYPNYANCDWSGNEGYDPDDPKTYFSTMGCRTANGWDINGFGQTKDGRGNICPVTIIMPTLAMETKVSLEENNCFTGGKEYDEKLLVDSFMEYLDKKIDEAKDMLIERYLWICKQSPDSAKFMYENFVMEGFDGKNIESAMKHGTLAVGQIGLAETLQILVGCNHTTKKGMETAKRIEQLFKDRCAEYKKEYSLNFGVYYTPAENLCFTAMSKFRNKYGEIPNVSDKKFFTNSMHVPVWEEMSPFEKIDIEAELTGYSSAGCITYVELPSSVKQNIDALEEIVNYAMDKDIPYFAVNVPNDMCTECGYTDEIGDECPICGCRKIRRLRRVTGYLTGDYIEAFNEGKRQEVDYRVKHFNNALKAKTEKNESH